MAGEPALGYAAWGGVVPGGSRSWRIASLPTDSILHPRDELAPLLLQRLLHQPRQLRHAEGLCRGGVVR